MSKKKLCRIIGIGMVIVGIFIATFGIAMRSKWQTTSQVPKVYDWNTDNLGEAPEVDNGDIDVEQEFTDSDDTSTVGENSTDGVGTVQGDVDGLTDSQEGEDE